MPSEKVTYLESLSVTGLNWNELPPEDATALILPPHGPTLLNVTDILLRDLSISDKGIKYLSLLLQHSVSLQFVSAVM